MQPIDRDTQIKLMRNSEDRMSAFVREMLQVPAIRDQAKRCAFEEQEVSYSHKTVKVVRYA